MKYLFLGIFYVQFLVAVHLNYTIDKNWQKVRSPEVKVQEVASVLDALKGIESYYQQSASK